MKVLDVVQGSPEWLAARTRYNTASEAPAMMGVSKYQTRSELLRQKCGGAEPVVSAAKQALFDRGHETEAMACTIVEGMIGKDLFPVTAVSDDDTMLASYDGLTADDRIGYEHKMWNEALAAQVRAGELDPHYYWQLEQQILVGGLDKVIFVCSDGTPNNFVSMEYFPVPGRAEQLVAGWKQFNADRAAYQHVEVLPAAVAAPIMSLPAVSVQMRGEIAVISNLDVFGDKLKTFIAGINRSPDTDQGFADAEAAIKTLKKAEDALETAEAAALSQTVSIDDMRRIVAFLKDSAREARLDVNRKVEARKLTIRSEQIQRGVNAFAEHRYALVDRLGKPYMPAIDMDFAGAIKGKKTITSLIDAIDTELARGKLEANAIADRIQANLKTLTDLASDFKFLFADTNVLVLKSNDDLTALVKTRIAEHQAEVAAQEAATREKIRIEEQAKAEKTAREEIEREQAQRRADIKVIRGWYGDYCATLETIEQGLQKVSAWTASPLVWGDMIDDATAAVEEQRSALVVRRDFLLAREAEADERHRLAQETLVTRLAAPDTAAQFVPATTVVAANVVQLTAPARRPAAPPSSPPTMKLGHIAERLGFALTGDFLKSLGFEPAARDKSAMLFHEADFTNICAALVNHINSVQAQRAA